MLRAACDACHRMKRKCDGKQPCTRCERRSRDCAYSNKQKSGPPKGSKRKLVEAEDDLPENRCVKPPRGGGGIALAASWLGRGDNEMTVVGARLAQCSSTDSAGSTPSPEARAAAAAAVAASCMNALAPVVPPALAAAGVLRPPPYNMLGPSSGLPGLSGGGSGGSIGSNVLPTVPLVTHPQYGTVYQHHQYPPEVYAVYLAELRQRSGSGSGIANSDGTAANEAPLTVEYDNSNMSGGLVSQPPRGCSDVDDSIFETTVSPAATTVAAATPSIGQVGDGSDISLPSSAAAPEHTTPAATAALAAAALAADVAAATETAGAGVTTPMTTTATTTVPTGSELLSEAVNFVEQLAGGGAGGEFLLADRGALPYPSRVSPSSQGGRVAAGSDGLCTSTIDVVDSAAASAALAAAVAAAIAEGYTTHHDNNGPEQEENGSSRVVLPSSRSGGGGGDDEGNKISFGGGDTCGTKDNLGHSPSAGEDVSPPPAKGNRFDAAPTMTGTKPRIAMPSTTTTENNAEDFACGSRATPRERQAAAGLLLYGATTYVGGGSGGGGSGRDREVSDVQHGRAAKEAGEYCQQRSPKAATDVRTIRDSGRAWGGGG